MSQSAPTLPPTGLFGALVPAGVDDSPTMASLSEGRSMTPLKHSESTTEVIGNDSVAAVWNQIELQVLLKAVVNALTQQRLPQPPLLPQPPMLRFDRFYELYNLHKKKLESQSHDDPALRATAIPKDLTTLASHERALYQLLACCCPTILDFRFGSQEMSSVKTWYMHSVTPLHTWQVDTKVAALCAKRAVPKARHQRVLQAIRLHRAELPQQRSLNSLSILKSDAAANTFDQQVCQVDSLGAIPPQSSREASPAATTRIAPTTTLPLSTSRFDRNAGVKVADALWTHANHVLGLPSMSKQGLEARPCALTLHDALQLLLLQPGPTRSKQELMAILQQLCAIVPNWISLEAGPSGKMTDPLSTLCIQGRNSDYRTIRQTIGGDKETTRAKSVAGIIPTAVSAPLAPPPPLLKRSSNLTSAMAHRPLKSVLASIATAPAPATAAVTTPPVSHTTTTTQALLVSSDLQGQRHHQERAYLAVPMATPTTTPPPPHRFTSPALAGTKRRASDVNDWIDQSPAMSLPLVYYNDEDKKDDGSNDQRSPKKKKLRINYHLILSDADHDGGEVLLPSAQQYHPRGLKELFDRLNAGERI